MLFDDADDMLAIEDKQQSTNEKGGKKARRSLDDRKLDYNIIKCYTYRCHFGSSDYNCLNQKCSGMYSIWGG